jgi:hypothetical protein
MPIDHLTCVSCGRTEPVDQESKNADRHCAVCGGSLVNQRQPGQSKEAEAAKPAAGPPVQLVASHGH